MKSTVFPAVASQRKVPLQTDAETFRRCGYALVDHIVSLLETIADRPVTKGEQPRQVQSFLRDKDLPVNGQPLETILSNAAEFLFDHSLFNGHPRFWGYITSSAAPGGILVEMLAASVNANVGAYVLSPAATEIERQTIRWIAEMIGFPQTCGGIFVSGGNMANFTALLAARKAKASWDIRQAGLGDKQMLIYCSKETHTWVSKAADLFGFGTQNIRWLGTNAQHQMDVEALEQALLATNKKVIYHL